MHAGEAKNGSGQRAKGDKFLPATVKTIAPAENEIKNARRRSKERQQPAEKQNKKCTPARRRTAAASGQKAANSPPAPSR
ncbi:hypothetical protein [Bianquea renquensis]|uniref:Uncharacterized protein n=1 Tax=Bianquea renquensis TaxID=2763661 RepID=A0A926HXN4_9FIRM|nr:hypothetical protein [Bianquea renquensis]MBC8543962.1 hypothetical protein [Bianquea renquensis]